LRSGEPGKPIENVFNAGFPNAFNYFWRIAAIRDESIPPLKRAAMGL
jgi:hypothetical protein